MNPWRLRAAGAALMVVVGFWGGTKFHRSDPAVGADRGGIAVPAGTASPPIPSDSADEPSPPLPIKIPDRLPQFSLEDREGKATAISSYGSKSLIINFWATWCAPCRSEIPLLQRLHAEWADRGYTVVGIAVDHRDEVLKFAGRYKIAYPLLIGEQDALDAAAAFGLETPVFPFTVFTDRRGEVVTVFVGELHKAQAELILSEVERVNNGGSELGSARRSIAERLRKLART